MSSRPDTPSTTTAEESTTTIKDPPPILFRDDWLDDVDTPSTTTAEESATTVKDPPPSLFRDDWLDVVATQGAYLVPRAGTPVWEKAYDDEFLTLLDRRLDLFRLEQIWRRAKYHDAADEWPMGHTPPFVIEAREAELKAMKAEWSDYTSGDGEDFDKGDGSNSTPGKLNPSINVVAGRLPTPPPFADKLPPTHGAKRARISEEVDEERISHTEENVQTAEEAVTTVSQQKGRKRRRKTAQVADEEAGIKEGPIRARSSTNKPWKQRLRPRAIIHGKSKR